MAVLIILLLSFLLAPLMALWGGIWGHFLWNWFIVPLGGPALSVVQLAGVFLFINYCKLGLATDKMDEGGKSNFSIKIGVGVITPPIFVFFAWLFKALFY